MCIQLKTAVPVVEMFQTLCYTKNNKILDFINNVTHRVATTNVIFGLNNSEIQFLPALILFIAEFQRSNILNQISSLVSSKREVQYQLWAHSFIHSNCCVTSEVYDCIGYFGSASAVVQPFAFVFGLRLTVDR